MCSLACACFNPRPTLSRRATNLMIRLFMLWLFQSAPDAFAPGDRPRLPRQRRKTRFNPRPTLSRRATRSHNPSAPPSHGFNPRPTLSRRATSIDASSQKQTAVSIRARRFRAGRPRRNKRDLPALVCFNPRPTLSRRATSPHAYHRDNKRVSIRARRFRAGRQAPTAASPTLPEFQSAPDAFAPGDANA